MSRGRKRRIGSTGVSVRPIRRKCSFSIPCCRSEVAIVAPLDALEAGHASQPHEDADEAKKGRKGLCLGQLHRRLPKTSPSAFCARSYVFHVTTSKTAKRGIFLVSTFNSDRLPGMNVCAPHSGFLPEPPILRSAHAWMRSGRTNNLTTTTAIHCHSGLRFTSKDFS
jgi:hypothetical protein